MGHSPTVLLTRSYTQSIAFASEFMARTGLQVNFRPAPLIDIVPTVDRLDVPEVSALLFTSAEAVRVFQQIGPKRLFTAYCVGEMTKRAAHLAGFIADSANGDVSDLLELATARHMAGDPGYFYPHGEQTAGDLAGMLRARGAPCLERVIYRQRQAHMADDIQHLIATQPVVLPLFSPNMARIVAAELEFATPHHLTLLAISPKVAEAAACIPCAACHIAEAPARAAMIGALAKILQD